MVASLVGDPARANMLTALMTGRALTATELAHQAGITPQTASAHLGKLETGGLIEQEKQGRHRYYRLADPDVAGVLEGLDTLIFAGGIGEHAPEVRERACQGLKFMGIVLDEARNHANQPVISLEDSPVTVRVIRTDEEWVIARTACRNLGIHVEKDLDYESKED